MFFRCIESEAYIYSEGKVYYSNMYYDNRVCSTFSNKKIVSGKNMILDLKPFDSYFTAITWFFNIFKSRYKEDSIE